MATPAEQAGQGPRIRFGGAAVQVKGAQDGAATQQPSAPVSSKAARMFLHIMRGRSTAANATSRWRTGLRGKMDVTLQVSSFLEPFGPTGT